MTLGSDTPAANASTKPSGVADWALAAMVFVAVVGISAVLVFVPKRVIPRELPMLRLDGDAAQAAVNADREAAKHVPHGDAVAALDRLIREHAMAELAGAEDALVSERRGEDIDSMVRLVERTHGPHAIAAIRASMVEKLDDALDGRLPETERQQLLGSFPKALQRYELMRGDRLVAPMFVVRTLYKARWNNIVGKSVTNGFSKVELRAYWGWLALRASSVDPNVRAEAARAYKDAGGADGDEALGLLLLAARKPSEALAVLQRCYAAVPSVRLRNYTLAAMAAND